MHLRIKIGIRGLFQMAFDNDRIAGDHHIARNIVHNHTAGYDYDPVIYDNSGI